MRRGILIALVLVPALAAAKPKKKKKATPSPTEEKDDKKDDEAKKDAAAKDAAPTPEPPGTPTVPATTKPGSAPASPGPLTTRGTAAAPAGTQPTPASSSAPATPPTGTTPPAEEEPPKKDGKEVDVDALRQEYLSLRDELFKSRARANAVASQLYSTRVTIKFTWGSARHYGVSKASIRLDGATVYEDSTGAIGNDDGVRFNGFVAPGRHLVTFHVEASGKDDDSFTSATESQIVVKAVANKDLVISAKGHDNGDIAYEWKRSEKGSYGLGIDVSVKTAGAKK